MPRRRPTPESLLRKVATTLVAGTALLVGLVGASDLWLSERLAAGAWGILLIVLASQTGYVVHRHGRRALAEQIASRIAVLTAVAVVAAAWILDLWLGGWLSPWTALYACLAAIVAYFACLGYSVREVFWGRTEPKGTPSDHAGQHACPSCQSLQTDFERTTGGLHCYACDHDFRPGQPDWTPSARADAPLPRGKRARRRRRDHSDKVQKPPTLG